MKLTDFHHQPGAHCGSTSLRNLAEFYGWNLAEPVCFGLASGLGFTYLELPMDPWRAFFGRPMWLEEAFFENLEIPHTHTKGDDWETAWDAVTNRLDSGDPVILFVDLYYLDYYETDTHFAPHSLLLVGYDEANDVAFVADNEFDEIQRLPISSLREAWSSKDMLPLEHRYLVVDEPTRGTSIEDATAKAVRDTADFMLDPESIERTPMPYGTHGIEGIRAMAENIENWSSLDDVQWVLRFAYQNIERRGTGGGLFRRLYASFLNTQGDAIEMRDAADRMQTIADEWTEIGRIFQEASELETPDEQRSALGDLADRIDRQASREAEFYRDIRSSL
ncbi:MAG: hypothetical protein ACI8UR_001072 [Natronomonas sp.]|jgi:hypothetical protein|uniref:BtrH N-terminal domain-containing protein n=1 Tax=Natronomonas sp. TaxID=2184060 RepID=UPI00398A4E8A